MSLLLRFREATPEPPIPPIASGGSGIPWWDKYYPLRPKLKHEAEQEIAEAAAAQMAAVPVYKIDFSALSGLLTLPLAMRREVLDAAEQNTLSRSDKTAAISKLFSIYRAEVEAARERMEMEFEEESVLLLLA